MTKQRKPVSNLSIYKKECPEKNLPCGTKSSYSFVFTAGTGTPSTGYSVQGNPVSPGTSGPRGFYIDQSSVIRYVTSGSATSASTPLQ